MPIPTSILDDIKSRLPLADYLERVGVALIPAGSKRMKCICPFHADKKPSMTISLDHNTYKCWVCDETGDIFDWVIKRDGLEFRDAVQKCADLAGVEIPDDRAPETPQQQKQRETISELLSQGEEIRYECAVQWCDNLFNYSARRPIYKEKNEYQTNPRSEGGRGRDGHILNEWEVGVTVDGDGTLDKVKDRLKAKGKEYTQNAYLASGMFILNKYGALQSLYHNAYTYPQPAPRTIMGSDGKPEHQAVSCISMKPFEGRDKKIRQLSEVEVVLDGVKTKIPTVSDGKKPMNFWLNPKALRSPNLIVVEGENDLLAVSEGLSMMDDSQRYDVVGIAGNISDEQLAEFCRCRQGEKYTWLMFDNDSAGMRYVNRFSQSMLETEKIAIEHILCLEWGADDMPRMRSDQNDIDDVLSELPMPVRGQRMEEYIEACKPYYEYLIVGMERM